MSNVTASSPNLVQLIRQLETQQAQHAQAAAAIAGTLGQISGLLGALLGGSRATASKYPPARGANNVATAAAASAKERQAPGRSPRRTFATTAEQSILAFIKQRRNPTTQEIKRHFASEGRGGSADNVLSKLFREKKLRREPLKGMRGSRFSVA